MSPGPYMTVHQADELKKLSEQHGEPSQVHLEVKVKGDGDTEPYGTVCAGWPNDMMSAKLDLVFISPDGEQQDWQEIFRVYQTAGPE